jgi:N-acetylglucosaminyldiphosphoundecaprenol N-acetyl-beta-D-mannosaminyltransferase
MTLLNALESSALPVQPVIGIPVTALRFDDQVEIMHQWAINRASRVVCVANVHMLMEAHRDPAFSEVMHRVDLVSPDGMPLVWMLRHLGKPDQDRMAGLDVFHALCCRAEKTGTSIFFLGSTPDVLSAIESRLHVEFPRLIIAGLESPPFRPLTDVEDQALIERINESGAGLVFVALGCPKQEKWMDGHRGRVHSVMIGLGGAFPVYAGIHKRAPNWVRKSGLEWAYRLAQEPRRLWRRYWDTNLPFTLLALRQLISAKNRSQDILSAD